MKATLLTLLLMTNALGSFCQSLVHKWSTDTLFLKPESAVYDEKREIIYISNVHGEFLARDGNGFISTIKPNGEIDVLKWVSGLDNPQGMGLHKGRLYVADIDRVVRIDVGKAKIEKIFKIDGAIFLNDISIDKNGDVYVSDCRTNKIHRIVNDQIETWLTDPLLSIPNGLLCHDDKVFILNMKNGIVYVADKSTRKLTEFCTGIKDCDGIVSDGKDGYFVSGAWQGTIYHLDSKGAKKHVLDLGKQKIITADIAYIARKKQLIIPTLDKTVMSYRWD
jgi:sugar lactone lactonase YvrE